MKKYIIGLILICFVLTMGWAQEIVYTNQTTIAWDAVTKLTDGSLIPTEDTITMRFIEAMSRVIKLGI